ncbi:MAG: DUF308 domain-containing protein, partial [Bacilli bacterium]
MKSKVFNIISALIYFAAAVVVLNAPVMSVLVLMYTIGIMLAIGGIALLVDAFSLPKGFPGKSFVIFEAILLVILGLFFIFGNAIINAATLIYLLLGWFIVTSIIQIS